MFVKLKKNCASLTIDILTKTLDLIKDGNTVCNECTGNKIHNNEKRL